MFDSLKRTARTRVIWDLAAEIITEHIHIIKKYNLNYHLNHYIDDHIRIFVQEEREYYNDGEIRLVKSERIVTEIHWRDGQAESSVNAQARPTSPKWRLVYRASKNCDQFGRNLVASKFETADDAWAKYMIKLAGHVEEFREADIRRAQSEKRKAEHQRMVYSMKRYARDGGPSGRMARAFLRSMNIDED